MVEKTIFGTMEDGREVSRYTLTNQNGVSASFLDLGAIWSTMLVPDRNGEMADVLLGHETVADCLVSDGHLGEAVGRNANRIGGAAFTLNDKKYELTANDGPNNLHSGMDFYRNRIWAAEYETGVNQVLFTLESPDDDQGYPGNASIRVTYTLTDENEVKIHYEGTCDQDTIFNMTNHAYFNLAGHESGPALSQMVYIDSDAITAVDKVLIPTGEIRKVMGTPMDFSDFKPIGRDIEADYDQLKLGGGYDHNWILNHESGVFSLAAAAIDEESGRRGAQTIVPKGQTVIQEGDTVVLGAEGFTDSQGILLKEILMTPHHRWCGKKIAEARFYKNTIIVMIKRGSQIIIPDGGTQILEGDRVVVYSQKLPQVEGRVKHESGPAVSAAVHK